MPGLPSYQKLILALQVLLLVVLVGRLFKDRLHRVYPFFFWFLIVEALQSVCPFLITYGTWLYRDVFLVSQTIIISFFTLVVLELLSIVLRDLKESPASPGPTPAWPSALPCCSQRYCSVWNEALQPHLRILYIRAVYRFQSGFLRAADYDLPGVLSYSLDP